MSEITHLDEYKRKKRESEMVKELSDLGYFGDLKVEVRLPGTIHNLEVECEITEEEQK